MKNMDAVLMDFLQKRKKKQVFFRVNKLFYIQSSTVSASGIHYDYRYPENIAERKLEVC